MDQQRFDALAQRLAVGSSTRRTMLGSLGGIVLGGLAAVGVGRAGAFERTLRNATSEEQSVLLYEELARIADEHTGSCAELQLRHHEFGLQHADLFEKHRDEQNAWSHDTLVEHAETYGERRQAASTRLLAALSRCRFYVVSAPSASGGETSTASQLLQVDRFANLQASPIALATPSSDVVPPPATPVAIPVGQQATPVVVPGATANECTGSRQVLCTNATSSSPVATVPATCDASGCTACVPDDYCMTTYPDLCPTADACQLANEDPSSTCFHVTNLECNNQTTLMGSDVFSIAAYIDSTKQWQSCDQPNYCNTYYPEYCPTEDACVMAQVVVPDESCCEQNCPISSSDCALNWIGGIGTGDDCLECMTAWCGSYSYCMQNCGSSACCDTPCSSDYVPPPPAGP